MICKDLDCLALKLMSRRTKFVVKADISSKDAKVKTLVIPTNEELMIALDTVSLVKNA